MAKDHSITPLLETAMNELAGLENLDIANDVIRDLVKEEIKSRIRHKLDEDPELKNEIKDAVGLYLEAKAKQIYAAMRLAKASAKLGISLLPPNIKDEMSKELVAIVEKEFVKLLDNTTTQ